jgi:LmbE family N-acetylglucosaminyl deacetylase
MLLPSLNAAHGYPQIYIAPHLDDVVLSCGGRIALQRDAAERVLVVTICAGSPAADADLSPFAHYLHGAWALGDDPVAQRRAEDAAALKVLRCDGLHLAHLDAPYRQPEYGERGAVFGTPAPGDPLLPTAQSILHQLHQQQPTARVYVPLGIGNHVDHQLVYAAGVALHDTGGDVVWYEDAPYAAKQPEAISARLESLPEHLDPDMVEIEPVLERKLRAIRCYASQLVELFGTTPMEQIMTEYAAAVAGHTGGYGERVWRRMT